MTRSLFFGVVLAALATVGSAVGLAQNASPVVERVWASNVGSTTGILSMQVNDQRLPSRSWFEVSKNADLSGAMTAGENRREQGYGSVQSHATLNGLTPGTTYYYRAYVSSPAGKGQSTIATFKTQAAAPPKAPGVSFISASYQGSSYLISYAAEGYGVGGTFYLLVSKSSSLAGAQRIGQGSFPASSVGQAFHSALKLSDYPDKTMLYYQAVAETAGGTTKSPIRSVEIRNAPY